MKTWVKVDGYNKQVSASIPAGSTGTDLFVPEVPSTSLTLKITAMGTYADLAAWSFVRWLTPFYPYNDFKDQMGVSSQPQELSKQPELSPGGLLWIKGANAGGVAYNMGIIIKGELGYYTYD
jgi:hypothetical protein